MGTGRRAQPGRPGQQFPHGRGRAGQRLIEPLRIRRGQIALEQLTGHAEGKAGLEFGAAAAQHPPAPPPGALTALIDQGRLAYPGAAFDHHDPAAVQQGVEGRELPVPFQQHISTVEPRSTRGTAATAAWTCWPPVSPAGPAPR